MTLTLVLAALTAWALTGLLRRYALSRNVLDIPNERSSHTQPTPRGGGVAFVLVFTVFATAMALSNNGLTPALIGLLGAGLLVAITGFIDDHTPLPARWRLVGHFAGALCLLWAFNGLPTFNIFNTPLNLGAWGWLPGALYIVWLLNLYNFMDGIDGLAGAEALCVAGGGALLYALLGHTQMLWLPLLLTCSVLGFLVWNFPPAKIFMGDAGSGFLGITLAGLSLQAGHIDPNLFYSWLILLGVFVVDATLTLLRRLARKQKVYQAHRSHAYQYASRKLGSHKPVTLAVIAINLLWLLPLATATALQYINGITALAIAYVPLVIAAWRLGAGLPEPGTTQPTHTMPAQHP
ncbi:MraY family glycosyltransferase [Pusillimonas minor]|uniref:Glycosyltransferase family 4 protein n=1 Tax=Pusillimonas minor TaxID=2697024 RepID=A0A842HNX6_9BURK|nr:glycosyltransferase family 4 protein [Pusillimonas minor]MBC2770609.1 glycosyltransferase family 4 protein [Pusillimonas minor]